MYEKQLDTTKLPPFLGRNNVMKEIHLLQATVYCRDGKRRLATPDKMAILDLSNSFHKRKLGKQQSILSDITKRCREQDISDLSNALSSKCNLTEPNSNIDNRMCSLPRPLSDPVPHNRNESSYKSFPTRKIFKRTKTDLQKQNVIKSTTKALYNGFYTRRSSGANGGSLDWSPNKKVNLLARSSGKKADLWAEPTVYSKTCNNTTYLTSRLEPSFKPKSKSCIVDPTVVKSPITREAISLDSESLSESRQH